MKAAWKGHIVLGQLGFPVRLYSATQSVRPKFNYIHEADGSAVERIYRCKKENHDIPFSELIRVIGQPGGTAVTVTNNELKATSADKTRIIDIRQFADRGSIDPAHYEKPYYIVPGRGGERAYALLREVLHRLDKIAAAQFAIYNYEHVAAIGIKGDLLILHQLRFANEVLPRSSVKSPALPKPSPDEIKALTNLVNRFSGPLYLEDYHDEQTERLTELIERKAKGLPAGRMSLERPPQTAEDDLLPALQDALARTKSLSR